MMKQLLVYSVDLARMKENGDFLCPYCGVNISPDDETGETCSYLGPTVRKDVIVSLLIRCNNCGNKISLTGFSGRLK